MELSSKSAIFRHSSAQLLRPRLGFMDLLPRRAFIVSSSPSSFPRYLRIKSQSQSRQSIYCASASNEIASPENSSSSSSNELGQFLGLYMTYIESHFVIDFILMLVWVIKLARIGEVKRVTKETNVSVKINLDGSGVADSSTGIPFLDHMLDVSSEL